MDRKSSCYAHKTLERIVSSFTLMKVCHHYCWHFPIFLISIYCKTMKSINSMLFIFFFSNTDCDTQIFLPENWWSTFSFLYLWYFAKYFYIYYFIYFIHCIVSILETSEGLSPRTIFLAVNNPLSTPVSLYWTWRDIGYITRIPANELTYLQLHVQRGDKYSGISAALGDTRERVLLNGKNILIEHPTEWQSGFKKVQIGPGKLSKI